MWQPGVGNSQSRRRFSPEVSGMRTPGHGIPQTGRKKYQRADKKDGIIPIKPIKQENNTCFPGRSMIKYIFVIYFNSLLLFRKGARDHKEVQNA